MKRLFKVMFILALVLCFTIPAFAIKILPYNVPLQDLMRWDKFDTTLRLSNPEGETISIAWPTTVDLWNYDGQTWTFNLPSGDTFAFGKGVLVGGTLELVNNSITVTKATGIGVHSIVTAVDAYTGWALGFFGQALISNTAGNAANAAGGVFEVNVTAAMTGGKTGIWAGIYAGAFANSTTAGSLPTAGIIVENIAGATVDMSTVPLMTFMTSGGSGVGGAMSQILFEIGNAEAAKTVGTLTTEMFYHQTLKCVVNATDYFIPMSTVEGTYTTLYLIDVTVAGATAIDIGTSAIGIDFTGTFSTAEIVGTAIEIDAGTSVSLQADTGTFDFVATGLEMNTLTITEAGNILANDATGFELVNEAATATNPTLVPNRAEDDTGIGWQSDVIHIVLGSTDEYNFAGTAFSTSTSDGAALGTSSLMWSDLFLADLGVIDFYNDVTLTHAANLLTFAGGNFRMGTTDRIEFRDATEYIHSLNDGYIDFVAGTGLRVAAGVTAIDIAATATGIVITNASTYAIEIVTDGQVIMGTGPDNGEVGIPVATSEHVLAVYSEVGTVHGNATSSFGIRSRYLIDYDQTNIVTFEAVDARLRVKQDLAGGVHVGVQGIIEASGSPAFAGGLNAAGSFTLDLAAGTTITGATYMVGVSIDSASHTDLVVTDTIYAALRIWAGDGPPVKEDWEYGIIMDDGDVGVGIQIGDAITGINLDGAYTTGLNIAGTLASPAARAIKSSVIIDVCDLEDGYGTNEFQLEITGTSAGPVAAMSSWVNMVAGTHGAGGDTITAISTGIYQNTAEIAGATIIFGMKMQGQVVDTDMARYCPFAINIQNAGTNTIDAIWDSASPLYLGYAVDTTDDAPIGTIPFFIDSNNKIYYIRLYD